ncbi:S8 family peptidase [Anoxybacteroides tepidamans]|uniref:S8 family peptidase n=1 Tax=Anoxybacteroides tepidamans TaxID=265948 RepID=UPI0004840A9B|nr:S8 family peptidase [Anoxybacillus tepidamans]
MNKKWIPVWGGIAVLLLVAAFFLPFHESRNIGQPNHVQRLTTAPQPTPNRAGHIMITHDNLMANHQLKMKLNSSSAVKIIQHNEQDESHYYKNQITVRFKHVPAAPELRQIEKAIDGKIVRRMNHIFVFESNMHTFERLEDYFADRADVDYAEPNYIYLQNEVPNDSLYLTYQWNLPAIQTEEGWRFSRGNKHVTIAVVDSGVDLNHPDLVHRLVPGYNAIEDHGLPQDDNGHGTHVAGIIASEANNRQGVAGITWFNRIMPIKALNSDGHGSSFDVAKGIIWAVDHGARVINLSLGNYQPSELLEEAVRYAYDRDVVLIAASGNDHSAQPSFPAAYPEVLSVGAVNPDGSQAEYSNYGDYLDVVAPGTNIASTFIHNQYAALSGTSMAAPHVTALAGLIRSLNPQLTNKQVIHIIRKSTIDLGPPGKDALFGNGLINIYKAMQMANQTIQKRAS